MLGNIFDKIPNAYKKLIIITEDFGNLRFDKILQCYSIKNLLQYAVDTLVVLKNSIKLDNKLELKQYNFNAFKSEILELPEFYFPYVDVFDKNIVEEFNFIWSESFNKINFNFVNFTHKDFNINNLVLLPNNKKYN